MNPLVGNASLTINASGTGNTLNGPGSSESWNITGVDSGNITNLVKLYNDVQTLNGGAGTNTFTFSPSATMGTIDGGGDPDADTIDG